MTTPVLLTVILGTLAVLSMALNLWQWILAARFRLHGRRPESRPAPGVTLVKPLKGCDQETAGCLRSWFEQEYSGPVQLLFGVASADDPVGAVVGNLMEEHPEREARLEVCPESIGPNAKVSTLTALQRLASHDILVVSDADVWVPPDLLGQLVLGLARPETGLVCCFYRLANAANLAMRWESLAANADFWSSVLQAGSLKPLDFALGAVMAVSRPHLDKIGGFRALAAYLADDYQLGRKIAEAGGRIELCPVVVECRSAPMRWGEVWAHQVRWSRTIRVCQPVPYFFSLLSNATLWPLLWLALSPSPAAAVVFGLAVAARLAMARFCERKLAGQELPREEETGQSLERAAARPAKRDWWLAPAKDLLQVAIWAIAFAGNRIVWRGRHFRVSAGGRLEPVTPL